MPIYNFAVHNGGRLEDEDGTELPNDAAAREYALQVVRELNRNNGNRWNGWKMESSRVTVRCLTYRLARTI
jgi:Domain of unknown function (DUF6894)